MEGVDSGVVLYEMVAGQPPFRGEIDHAVIYSIANEQQEPLSAVRTGTPKDLERIVDKCLAKKAGDRYQHVTDVLVDLQACRRALDPQAHKPVAKAAPADRTRLAAMVAVLVLAGLGLAWWLTRSTEQAAPPQYKLTQITRDTGYTGDPALSPDGRLLAYASDRGGDGNLDIWVQQLSAASEPVRLTHHEADDFDPSFSPDGSRVVFNSRRDGGGIYVVPALGGSPTRLADAGQESTDVSSPRFSPDGRSVSFHRPSVDSEYRKLSQIEVVPASSGPPRVVEVNLPVALAAIWSPDGQYLLFIGSNDAGGTPIFNVYDWWLAPVSGGEAVRLGARELFGRRGITATTINDEVSIPNRFPRPLGWLTEGNRVIFAGAMDGGATNVWQVVISPADGKLVGDVQRLTSGTGEEEPSVTQDGRIAFVNRDLDLDIWGLPLDANRAEVLGEPERVVSGLSHDAYPTISSDGRKLCYVSDRAGNFDVWLRDLTRGEDAPMTIGPEPETRAAISPDGSMISFIRGEQGKNNLYVMDVVRRRAKLLVEDVGNMFDWTPDGKRILYYTPPPLRYKTVDGETGAQSDVDLTHPERLPSTLRYSPDGEWLAFNHSTEPDWPILVARIEGGQPAAYDEWIPVYKDSVNSHPWWSPDGNTVYFRSSRDGFHCIFAQPLEPRTKKPFGPLKSIQHFHERLRTVNVGSGLFGYAMTGDRLYLPLSEPKANIWLAEPVEAK